MLEFALARPHEPGTNTQRPVVDASWLFLLPSLELRRVSLLHPIDDEAAEVLVRAGADLAEGAVQGAELVVADAASFDDAVELAGDDGSVWTLRLPAASGLDRIQLSPVPPRALQGGSQRAAIETPFGAATRAPVGSNRVSRVVRRALARAGVGLAPDATARARRLSPVRGEPSPGGGALVLPTGTDIASLPAYIRELSSQAIGTWSIAPDAGYRSQKLLFITDRDVVKVSRHPDYSHRLLNEHRALTALADKPVAAGLPSPRFEGTHAGLAIVGEEAVEGQRFAEATTGTSNCPVLTRAAEWLTTLAATTRSRPTANGLDQLVARYERLYEPAAAESGALRHALGTIEGVPAVAMHGDAAVWNLLVRSGNPVFLDWENYEAQGPPLWDTAYLFQTAAAQAAERSGRRVTGRLIAGSMEPTNEWGASLRSVARAQLAALGVPDTALEPLILLGWVYQAVKEATRLPPSRLATGRYRTVVTAFVERNESG